MASASPFDDLLKEFDDDVLGPRHPPEDPLRGENLQKLLALSKKLETIAKTLDPSDAKHPLYGQTVPETARVRLKALVGELMRVQDGLHSIEKALLETKEAETATEPPPGERPHDDLDHPPSLRESHLDPLDDDPSSPRQKRHPLREHDDPPTLPPVKKPSQEEDPFLSSSPKLELLPKKETGVDITLPVTANDQAAPHIPVAPAQPAITPDHLQLEQEKQAFEAYRASWEQVFRTDPSQRAAHPEVQQYYDQMETYFKEKMAYITTKNQQP